MDAASTIAGLRILAPRSSSTTPAIATPMIDHGSMLDQSPTIAPDVTAETVVSPIAFSDWTRAVMLDDIDRNPSGAGVALPPPPPLPLP